MTIASSGAISVGNAAGSNRSINIELGRTHNTTNSSFSTLAGVSYSGAASLLATPHAMSEWHSYEHTVVWVHTVTVEGWTESGKGATIYRYGYQGVGTVKGAISDTSPDWADSNDTVSYFYFDKLGSSAHNIQFQMRHTSGSNNGDTGFSSVSIGGNVLDRDDAVYSASSGNENWRWALDGDGDNYFGTTDDVVITCIWFD